MTRQTIQIRIASVTRNLFVKEKSVALIAGSLSRKIPSGFLTRTRVSLIR